jgi:hypothetical protein
VVVAEDTETELLHPRLAVLAAVVLIMLLVQRVQLGRVTLVGHLMELKGLVVVVAQGPLEVMPCRLVWAALAA